MNKLEEIVNDILDATDYGKKNPKRKLKPWKVKFPAFRQLILAVITGELSTLAQHPHPTETVPSRHSLDISFTDASPANTMVKLLDIPVPKFDGNVKNFTQSHSLVWGHDKLQWPLETSLETLFFETTHDR